MRFAFVLISSALIAGCSDAKVLDTQRELAEAKLRIDRIESAIQLQQKFNQSHTQSQVKELDIVSQINDRIALAEDNITQTRKLTAEGLRLMSQDTSTIATRIGELEISQENDIKALREQVNLLILQTNLTRRQVGELNDPLRALGAKH